MSDEYQQSLRERLQQDGSIALSIAELLAVILRAGDEDSLQLAETLLSGAGGLRRLSRFSYDELVANYSLRPTQAAQIMASLELARRLISETEPERPVIKTAEDAARLLRLDMEHLPQENLRVILLDGHRRVMATPTVYIGSLHMTIIRVAEVFREAMIRNAASIILAHNHPSGDPTPSAADVELTEMVVEAGRLLDIPVHDHIIIGHGRWVSLRDTGVL